MNSEVLVVLAAVILILLLGPVLLRYVHKEGYYVCRGQGNEMVCKDLPMDPGDPMSQSGAPKTL